MQVVREVFGPHARVLLLDNAAGPNHLLGRVSGNRRLASGLIAGGDPSEKSTATSALYRLPRAVAIRRIPIPLILLKFHRYKPSSLG